MTTRFDDWPVVPLLAEEQAPGVVRDAVLDLLADRDFRTAEHAGAVRESRPALAFAGGRPAPAPEAGLRFRGCPVVRSTDSGEAVAWARESLAAEWSNL
ncbi:hypothetical protein SUDANB145_01320 [Streptomyces sp. enrichment culture]|uniref:hypothetical protein n=1 Tax=Streptomyces sp. enrichment culture TaxID=1795815 RepID=UPI003F54E675